MIQGNVFYNDRGICNNIGYGYKRRPQNDVIAKKEKEENIISIKINQ